MIEKKKKLFLCLALICMTGLYASSEAAKWEDIGSRVIVEDDLMSVDIDSIALNTVLEKIKDRSGIRYWGDKEILKEKITISFDKLPVEVGLKRVLTKFNYSLTYDSSGLPSSVLIIGKRDTKSSDKSEVIPIMSDSARVRRETARNERIYTPAINPTPQLQSAKLEPVEPIKIPKEALSADSSGDRRGIVAHDPHP
jgi:hypothetical protein